MKNKFCLLLLLICLSSPQHLLAVSILDSGTCGENLTWTLTNDSVLTISGTGDMDNYSESDNPAPWYGNYWNWTIKEIIIYDGVTSIGRLAFEYCRYLESVTIPYSVTSIGNYAFRGCSSLESVTIPNSVTSIGWYAFYGCNSLTSVTIPNSVTSIGPAAFSACYTLTAVHISDIAAWCAIDFDGYYANPLYYGANLYLNDDLVTDLIIPETVETIQDYAFYGYSSLTSVTIPNNVTSIGQDAFYNVLNIVYSGSATGAPWGAQYMNCYGDGYLVYSDNTMTTLLRCSKAATGEIIIPNSVTSIGDWAFSRCSGLTSVTIGNSVTSIDDYAFSSCSGLTSVTIPNSVTHIGEAAFSGCSGLTTINVEEGNTIYDSRNNCNAIIETATNTLITGCMNTIIPNSVTSIGDAAFYNCRSLTNVTIPNSVTSIGIYAFYNCISLTSVTIGNSVTSIGIYAFSGCNGLAKMTVLATTPPILVEDVLGENAFLGLFYHIPVHVPCESLEAYTTQSGWSDFTNYINIYQYDIELEVSDPVMGQANFLQRIDCDKVLIEAIPTDGHYFLCWSDGIVDNTRTITLSQDTILKAEFYAIGTGSGKCGDNLYWTLADGNLFITGSGAMYDYTEETQPWYKMKDYIRSVSFPAEMTTVGDYAFYGCKNITSVLIPQNVTTIGEYSFAECSLLSSVTIGAGVTTIGCGAFYNDWSIEEIYCYPYNAPTVCETAFNGIIKNYVYLYVQGDRVRHYQLNPYFTNFDIRAIGAETVPSDDDVVVVPSERDAQFTWPANGNASSYTLQITKDGEVFCTLVFNEYGQLTGIAFAPARNGEHHPRQAATATTNGWQFTVTGLNEGSAYAYTLDVKDASNQVLNSYNGTFRTLGTGTSSSIDTPDKIGSGLTSNACKVIENGTIYIILPDGRKLNMQGAEVK